MISVRILADSINPNRIRITSWLLKYPKFFHADVMTHRVLSRSAASSRAIPINKMISEVIHDPAAPEFWGANQKGMAATQSLTGLALQICMFVWMQLRWFAVAGAWVLSKCGAHKQIANRVLEPWYHITLLVTCTDHSNLFTLRAHPAAQPEFQVMAYRMLDLYLKSKPRELNWGEWHVPKFSALDVNATSPLAAAQQIGLKVVTAHCARMSYKTQDGEYSLSADVDLFNRLFGPPMHAGPFEHPAQAIDPLHQTPGSRGIFEGKPYPWSNFDDYPQACGWGQYRKFFDGECVKDLDTAQLQAILNTKPEWVSLS